ncbi:MAG TPA: hypothetical protein ENG65_03795 [Candidatus Bathyarchaeota archaeon]|nr:hypothetical protein [Candidatus Bathyarchaeota archaeon]
MTAITVLKFCTISEFKRISAFTEETGNSIIVNGGHGQGECNHLKWGVYDWLRRVITIGKSAGKWKFLYGRMKRE